MANDTDSPSKDFRALDTRIVHGPKAAEGVGSEGPWASPAGAVNVPIYQSSVFGIESTGYEGLLYPRYNNLPDQKALADRLADLEGGEAATATASGMAAISAGLLSVLGAGDHLLVTDGVYGGTQALVRDRFPKLGIEHTFVAGDDPDAWHAALRPNTRAVYTETITNPLMRVPDLAGIAAFAREHELAALIDNTFGTPLAFRPLEAGFDLSLHSATKYLNGHSDLVAGAVVGSAARMAAVEKVMKTVGGSLDPHAGFLLMRGMKTLALRFRRQCETAGTLAAALEEMPEVARVAYPGLASHPDHARARSLLSFSGGMLAFEVAAEAGQAWEAARRFLSRVRVAFHAPSLGGVETLVVSPSRSSHAGLAPEERQRQGITDGLVRVSVGIEDADDLVADFRQALGR